MSDDMGNGNLDEDSTINRRRRTVKVKAFGVEVELRGYDIIITLLAFLVLSLSFMVYAMQGEHKDIQIHQTRQEDILQEMIYVLSLTPAEREHLNILMPESLKRKQRARVQYDQQQETR